MLSETKIDESFPTSQFIIKGFATPFRLDRNSKGGGILVYVREDIPAKLVSTPYISKNIECIALELNLRKMKWLVTCSYNPHKEYIANHLSNISKILSKNSSQYERFLCIGDFNSEPFENSMKEFCDVFHLQNLVKEPTCFKNFLKPSCIDLILTNCSKSFQDTRVVETGLSDFHRIT